MPLRGCVIRRRLDKSDRIDIETCDVFHCATVSSDIFGTAVSIARNSSVASKLSSQSFFVSKIKTEVPKTFDDDTVKHIARLC